MTDSNFNNIVSDHCQLMNTISYQLEDLSDCFERIGNSKVSDEISSVIKAIRNSSKELISSWGSECNRQVTESVKSTNTMMAALFAGMTVKNMPEDEAKKLYEAFSSSKE